MKRTLALLLAGACVIGHAAAPSGERPEPARRAPVDPGLRTTPPPAENAPTDPGAVVTPPRTGTEEIMKTPRKAVDPKIDDATSDIDRRNQRKSEQKSAR